MTTSRGPAVIMYLVGAFEFLLGATFIGVGTVVPAVQTTFILVGGGLAATAVILVLVGRRFHRRFREAQALREHGVRGSAQVLGANQTGVYLNEQPQMALQLRITAPGHGTYDTTIKEYVPFIAIGMLGTGRPLTVLVDPLDPAKVIVEWSFAAGPVAAPTPPPSSTESAFTKAQILASGVPGTIRVLSAEFAGSLDDQGRPLYSAQLHIAVDGRSPVAGPAVFAVPLERVSVMQPGGVIPIKADPFDPMKFAADWDRLATG
ncbi:MULTISPECIES: hypothetical protein [Dactylosporangium]|uniref:Uncharacterized protein n=2 Tax=Dactylosporangium TaxID=35753 RepID=A0A9W6NPZ5_9ACTN|nr:MULTISPECIES: hypothetical protein [Dactylosporangium]UAB95023.1 hypothetical protein Dvina_44305 [Dactylosporangium vinaceum]UWZ43387.1 hypothetical protein Dmats_38900 [Dactylosporangium matsuzakiense]GLL05009.1 hypothetical protein GCM10017581_067560 [Dactylosporangium matsuzakiense]